MRVSTLNLSVYTLRTSRTIKPASVAMLASDRALIIASASDEVVTEIKSFFDWLNTRDFDWLILRYQ